MSGSKAVARGSLDLLLGRKGLTSIARCEGMRGSTYGASEEGQQGLGQTFAGQCVQFYGRVGVGRMGPQAGPIPVADRLE